MERILARNVRVFSSSQKVESQVKARQINPLIMEFNERAIFCL